MRLEYFESTGNARVRLVWDAGVADDCRRRGSPRPSRWRGGATWPSSWPASRKASFATARCLAARPPGGADPAPSPRPARPIVVVLVGGSAITMSRVARSRGGGRLRVVSRRSRAARRSPTCCSATYNPAGRLPITFPIAEGQLPLYVQPQTHGARRRLRRSHRAAALSVRLRAELHHVRILGPRDRAGGRSASAGTRDGPMYASRTPARAPATRWCSSTCATCWPRSRGR